MKGNLVKQVTETKEREKEYMRRTKELEREMRVSVGGQEIERERADREIRKQEGRSVA